MQASSLIHISRPVPIYLLVLFHVYVLKCAVYIVPHLRGVVLERERERERAERKIYDGNAKVGRPHHFRFQLESNSVERKR